MVTMTSSAETSAGLMRLAADGDEVAFARIVDAHHADMSSVCFVVTGGDVELTEEAVQSAWPIAWRRLDTIRDPELPRQRRGRYSTGSCLSDHPLRPRAALSTGG